MTRILKSLVPRTSNHEQRRQASSIHLETLKTMCANHINYTHANLKTHIGRRTHNCYEHNLFNINMWMLQAQSKTVATQNPKSPNNNVNPERSKKKIRTTMTKHKNVGSIFWRLRGWQLLLHEPYCKFWVLGSTYLPQQVILLLYARLWNKIHPICIFRKASYYHIPFCAPHILVYAGYVECALLTKSKLCCSSKSN